MIHHSSKYVIIKQRKMRSVRNFEYTYSNRSIIFIFNVPSIMCYLYIISPKNRFFNTIKLFSLTMKLFSHNETHPIYKIAVKLFVKRFCEVWRDLNSRLPLAVPEIRFPRYRSANFDRGAFALLAVSATGGARRQSLTRGSRGRLKPCHQHKAKRSTDERYSSLLV